MNFNFVHLNLIFAWLWICIGFIIGFILGLNFHREDWLGGYTSFKRRLYRLAHISFFGLAIINLLFYFTIRLVPNADHVSNLASWGFLIGAASMPGCCFAMAHNIKLRALFLIPVVSLLTAGVLTLWELVKL